MTIALILAAGSGSRLQAGRPKALVQLEGRTLLQWSVDALARTESVHEIVVALPEGGEAPPGTRGVRGGQTRSESVRAALAVTAGGDPVLVHDAARPLLTPQLAEAVIASALTPGAAGAVAAAPVTDTIKCARPSGEAGGERFSPPLEVQSTLSRDGLWAVQTPQVFRRAQLQAALDQPAELLRSASDDASLVEAAGGRVLIVPSTAENVKITTQTDMQLAALLLRRRRA